jgi:hypothetical protein
MPYSLAQSHIPRTRPATRVCDPAVSFAIEAAGDRLLAVHEPTGRHAPASSAPVETADAAPERPVRVLVADDDPARRKELSELHDAQPDFRVIAAVRSAEPAAVAASHDHALRTPHISPAHDTGRTFTSMSMDKRR